MGKLYQTIFTILLSVGFFLFIPSQQVFSANWSKSYNNNACAEAPGRPTSCKSGELCAVTPQGNWYCTDRSTKCGDGIANNYGKECTSGEICILDPYTSGLTSICKVLGQGVTDPATQQSTSPVTCSSPSSTSCPSGTTCGDCQQQGPISGDMLCYCLLPNGEKLMQTTTRVTGSGPKTSSLGIDQLMSFWNQGYANDSGAFPRFVSILYRIVLPIGIIFGILLVAGAGYSLMTSQGDPQKATDAKEHITSAIIGLLFVLLGAGILRAIISTLIQGASSGL